MVVKNKVVTEHLNDLGTVFEILRKHKLMPQSVPLELVPVNF